MASSGWWLASRPIEPVVVRVETISTRPTTPRPRARGSPRGTWCGPLLLAGLAVAVLAAPALILARVALLGLLLLALAARVGEDVVDRALEQERALGDVVVLALEDLLEAADGLGDRHVHAGDSRELLGHVERLRQEPLDPPRAVHGDLVLVRELVDAEDGDDVLELLVALEDLLDLVSHVEVLLADDLGLEDRRGGVERVDGGVDPLLGDRPGERRRGVQMCEHRRRRRVRQVVRRDVDGLDRGDGALAGR